MEKLRTSGLHLKKEKCQLFKEELVILGYKIKENIVQSLEERLKGIEDFPEPKTIKELRSFLGITSYCRNFIKDLATLAAPLNNLLKDNPPLSRQIKLGSMEKKAFERVKTSISKDSTLAIPDYEKPFILTTDASETGLSGILSQMNDRKVEQPVYFFSKKLTESQTRYSATQRELLAVVESMVHFKPYLFHKRFKLRTDHQALTALKHTRNQNSMLFRWSLLLSDFEIDVEYIKGEANPADALSRVEQLTVNSLSSQQKKVIIQDELKKEILTEYHEELGHGSAGDMMYVLKRKYEWIGMERDVKNHVDKCMICLRSSNVPVNTEFKMIETGAIGELVEIDIVGPFSQSQTGNKFMVTCIDHFSKYTWAKAADLIYNFLEQTVLKEYPKVKTILSDNGKEFKSPATLLALLSKEVRWEYGSPYYPQTQGAVERFNGTIQKN
ncbi:MAG: DDE-type integrase/transposase/recombinase [Streptococcus sp.]|nr:DDE-type integrase/transposase/recombinase [Streptococcus sp.]